jgi:hypothetical protein
MPNIFLTLYQTTSTGFCYCLITLWSLLAKYRVSHVSRNPPTSMRRLRAALWLIQFRVVRPLLLRHNVVPGFNVKWDIP